GRGGGGGRGGGEASGPRSGTGERPGAGSAAGGTGRYERAGRSDAAGGGHCGGRERDRGDGAVLRVVVLVGRRGGVVTGRDLQVDLPLLVLRTRALRDHRVQHYAEVRVGVRAPRLRELREVEGPERAAGLPRPLARDAATERRLRVPHLRSAAVGPELRGPAGLDLVVLDVELRLVLVGGGVRARGVTLLDPQLVLDDAGAGLHPAGQKAEVDPGDLARLALVDRHRERVRRLRVGELDTLSR